MKKYLLLTVVLLLILTGCGNQKAYGLSYQSPYLAIAHSDGGEDYFRNNGTAFAEDGLPVVLITSRTECDAFCNALEANFSKETADIFREHFEKTEQDLYSEDLFAVWSIAVIYCCGTGNVGHILEERSVRDGVLQLRYSRVVTAGKETGKTGWLIPVWLTKVSLEDVTTLDARVAETYEQRCPLKVTRGEENEQHTLMNVESVRDAAVKTYGFSKVEIDFAGERKLLQTALEEGLITPQQLVTRARIDAAGGLCDVQQYNDGGTVVYIYEDYRLYKIKQFTASGTVEGDVWITAVDVELNRIK